MPQCACTRMYSGTAPICPFCTIGAPPPRIALPRQGPVIAPPMAPVMPVLRAIPVVALPPPPPVLAPNTLPAGSNLEITCARSGQHNFVALNAGARLYVLQGARLEFRASQTGAAPAYAPLINFQTSAWGGTAGAGAAGAACTVAFNTLSASDSDPGAFTVTLTFAAQVVTIRCIVYKLTGVLTPANAFVGHHATHFGVDERVGLNFASTPAGLAAATVQGLRWKVSTSGRDDDGLLHNPATNAAPPLADGLATYIAPCRTHAAAQPHQATRDVRLRLEVVAGVCATLEQEVDIVICKPSAHMRIGAGSRPHTQGTPSAGFKGEIFLTPKDVSFQTLRWREGTGAIRTYGFGNDAEDGVTNHAVTAFVNAGHGTVQGGNINNGSLVNQLDTVESGEVAGYVVPDRASDITEVGKETWPIHWEYTYADLATGNWTVDWIRMQIAYHIATLYESGRMTMFKGHVACAEGLCNATVSKNLNDPTVL